MGLMKTDVGPTESWLFSSPVLQILLFFKRFDPTACADLMKATRVTGAATCLFDFHTCIKSK